MDRADETKADVDLGPPPPPVDAVPSHLQCRYPNKPCPHPRVPKKRDGDLHSYCEYHRQKAQQYQRKLELKKREQRRISQDHAYEQVSGQRNVNSNANAHANQRQQAQERPRIYYYDRRFIELGTGMRHSFPSGTAFPAEAQVSASILPISRVLHRRTSSLEEGTANHRDSTNTSANVNADATAYEPFTQPVTLQDDDIHVLQSLFVEDGTLEGSGVRPGPPSTPPRRASTGTAPTRRSVHYGGPPFRW